MSTNTPDAPRILLVEDDLALGRMLAGKLQEWGLPTLHLSDPGQAIQAANEHNLDLIIADLNLPQMDGIALMRELRRAQPGCEWLMITGDPSVETVRRALKLGATDYLTKPLSIDSEFRTAVHNALDLAANDGPSQARDHHVITSNPGMQRIQNVLLRAARSEATILLLGESGVGKEVLAKLVHNSSARKNRPFLRVNCAALSATLVESELFGHTRGAFTGAHEARTGLFEAAAGGTVLLDEVGELPLSLQPKLLGVLENRCVSRVGEAGTERPIDVRIIAATNRDLAKAVSKGEFRADLYYRLCVIAAEIPPLRDRPEDIEPLVRQFSRGIPGQSRAFSTAALAALRAYAWPGNVRELRNAVERSIVLAEGASIEVEDLPDELVCIGRIQAPRNRTLNDIEVEEIRAALERSGGNLTRAAVALGLTRRTLGYRMRKHSLVRTGNAPPQPSSCHTSLF